jgi:glycerol-3-phosphate dehydrogenase
MIGPFELRRVRRQVNSTPRAAGRRSVRRLRPVGGFRGLIATVPHVELRQQNIDRLSGGTFDVLVIGGGINGAVTAAALAARDISVAMVERSDFASFTSQESSNLIWGGFKYLENYELKLVWDLCTSRNLMMKSYPSRIKEIDFLATLDQTAPFPVALAALGSVGYWGIGRFATKSPRFYTAKGIEKAEPLVNTATAKGGIRYADAYLPDNDARFVWEYVRTALDDGATAVNYCSVDKAEQVDGGWKVEVTDTISGEVHTVSAKAIVNAAGPFVDGLNDDMDLQTEHRIVYSKGIHLIVPKLTEAERVLAFFDDTGRLFYVIPMAHRSVIGTTDTRTDNPSEGVLDEDRDFLLEQINARLDLDTPLTKADIISERCGVRPLVVKNDGNDRTDVDWTSLSRKHEIETDKEKKIITIFGGKLTDCLNVGDEITEELASIGIKGRKAARDWFGEPGQAEWETFLAAATVVGLDRRPDVEHADTVAEVVWRRHGRAAHRVLELIAEDPTLAEPALANSDLLRAELPVMAEREMIVRPDDFLRRRTKLALITHRDDLGADPGMAEVNATFGF